MSPTRQRLQGRGGLEIIEEAVHVLRTLPLAALSTYYLGTAPFVLGALYFWADLSASPSAAGHLSEASLGLATLFVWMKTCQAVFAGRVRSVMASEAAERISAGAWSRLLSLQALIQATGLAVLPVSMVLALPFAWVYAFYQNATALGLSTGGGAKHLVQVARRQAALWPRQNHVLMVVIAGFGFGVWLNWLTAGLVLPELLRMLFGVQSSFTRSGLSLLNTTFFATMAGLTYLTLDPIVKVAYALRCFYGEAVESGADLQAELSRAEARGALVISVALWLCLCQPTNAATETGSGSTGPVLSQPGIQFQVTPPELDRSIEQVIHQNKYTWRMPREKAESSDSQPGMIRRFLSSAGKTIGDRLRAAAEWIRDWLRKIFGRDPAARGGDSGFGWILSLELLLCVLIAVVVGALGFWLLRSLHERRRQRAAVSSQVMPAAPDLSDENLGAEHLPETGWAGMGRELLGRGEFRLALRAFYLASLAHLADRHLISLARFKSNREYENELRRRGHALPEIVGIFDENLAIFERSWYGLHEVSAELVEGFAANLDRMRGSQ